MIEDARLHCRLTLALLVGLLTSLSSTAAAQPLEARCATLGSNCRCSEPLNYNQNAFEDFDPPDSEGSQAKECSGGVAVDAEPTGWVSVDEVEGDTALDFPNGFDGYVQRMRTTSNDGDNGWWLRTSQASGLRNETLCQRYYFRIDPDMPPCGTDQRFKATQFLFAGGGLYQSQMAHDGSGRWDMFGESNCQNGFNHDWHAAAIDSWVRVEHCHDIGSGSNIALGYRVQLTSVDTGFQETRICQTSDRYNTPVTAQDVSADLFIQEWGDSRFRGVDRYTSFYMSARVPYDPDFYIGAASELESGTPPPPPPSPPAAPVLLDE